MSTRDRSLLNDNRTFLDDHDFCFVSGSPLVSHCHHFNLFFEQIIDDALGWDVGQQVRMDSAYEASSQLLNGFISEMPPTTLSDRLDIACSMFAAMGLGELEFKIAQNGSRALGRHLHYGYTWRRERGQRRNPKHVADAVCTGYIMAAVEAAFGLSLGSLRCVERSCIATGDGDVCEFDILNQGADEEAFGVTKDDIRELMPETFAGLHETSLASLAGDLREFVVTTQGDKRGLIESFGVFLTHHMANYYNHCANRMLSILEEEKPGAVEVAKELLRDCGHQDGYFLFGGVLRSAEWGALAQVITNESSSIDIIKGCLAIARAFGFGRWCLEEYKPETRLILQSPGTYESAYRKVAYPDSDSGCCFVYQGTALAIMDLAHRVDWDTETAISPDSYRDLRTDIRWKATETHCISDGHDMCRVVVEC